MFRKKVSLFAAAVAVMLLAAPLAASHKVKVEEASVLLQRIESNAMAARHHAARLKNFTAFPGMHSWRAHSAELGFIKSGANDMADLLAEFKNLKTHASKRQNKAFNYALPEATKLSTLVEEAIRIVNDQKHKIEIAHPDYENTIKQYL